MSWKTKFWNTLFISGLTTATIVGVVVPLAINAAGKPLTPIQKAEYQNNYQLLRDSSLYQVNQLTQQDNRLVFMRVIHDIVGRRILLLAFDHATVLIDLRTGITLETLTQTLSYQMRNAGWIFGGSLGLLYQVAYFYHPVIDPNSNGMQTIYTDEDLLNHQLFIPDDIPNKVIQEVYDKRVRQAQMYDQNHRKIQIYGQYIPSMHTPEAYNRYGKFNVTHPKYLMLDGLQVDMVIMEWDILKIQMFLAIIPVCANILL